MPATLVKGLDEIIAEHAERGTLRTIATKGDVYLYRVYLGGRERRPYLHKFMRSDERVHHNHPWDVSGSCILAGSYIEHRLNKPPRTLKPGDWNTIRRSDFHYVELVDGGPVYTLFCPGQRVGSWGFMLPDGSYVDWEEYKG